MNPFAPGKHGRVNRCKIQSAVEKIRVSGRSNRQALHKRAKLRQSVGVLDFKKTLRCGLLNVDGLGPATLEDVKAAFHRRSPDLCILLETKRRAEEIGSNISIEGYDHHELRRSTVAGDRGGGGIAVYTKKSDGLVFHRFSPKITDESMSFVNKERCWMTLTSQNYKTAVCGTYIGCQYPDDRYKDWNNAIYSVIQKEAAELRASGHRVIILGDMNAHVGNNIGEGIVGNKPGINPNGHRYLDFLRNIDSVHINGACRTPGQWDTRISRGLWTRQRGGISTVVDYAGVSREHLQSVISLDIDDIGENGTGSDHNWMFLDVADKFVKKRRLIHAQRRKPSWNISDDQDWTMYRENIVSRIKNAPLTQNMDSLNTFICESLHGALTEEIGLRTPASQKPSTELPRSIVDELAFRRQLEANWKSKQTTIANRPAILVLPEDRVSVADAEQLFLDQSNKVSRLLFSHRFIKRKSILEACKGPSTAATKRFWSYVSPSGKQSADITAVISPTSGVLKCEIEEIKHETEQHFLETFQGSFECPPPTSDSPDDHSYASTDVPRCTTDHAYSINPHPVLVNLDSSGSLETNPSEWINKSFTTPEVSSIVKKLKSCKAKGWDSIPNEAIKFAPPELIVMITRLFNMVKVSGSIPYGWNRGRITLIFKSGLRERLSNYRPITVIICLSGLYSKVLNERLISVVEYHKLLGEIQNGFRKERGGPDNSFILDTLLWKAKALRKQVHLAFVDISKAVLNPDPFQYLKV